MADEVVDTVSPPTPEKGVLKGGRPSTFQGTDTAQRRDGGQWDKNKWQTWLKESHGAAFAEYNSGGPQ
jgi:hypothetical protein